MTLTDSEPKARRKKALGKFATAKIARQTRRTHGHTWQVLDGTRWDAKVVRAAAKRAKMPAEELFPEYAEQIKAEKEAEQIKAEKEAASRVLTPG